MSIETSMKKWIPGLLGLSAVALLLFGASLTWKALARSAGGSGEVRLNSDPGELPAAAEAGNGSRRDPSPDVPEMVPGTKPPSSFRLPQYRETFDFHSMEAGKLMGSSAFLVRTGSAQEVAQFYLLELGSRGWELLWQRDASIRPENDPGREAMRGTRLRWLDRAKKQQLTLLVVDDVRPKHTAQGVLSWFNLPGRGKTVGAARAGGS